PGRGAQMARSAGTSAQITAREGALVTLRLPSGERRRVRAECRATVGVVGNRPRKFRLRTRLYGDAPASLGPRTRRHDELYLRL
ncbi:MAG: hypothetical protein QXG03_10440, partial [Halalkalicoccus sp.]